MSIEENKKRIAEILKDAGLYKPFFDSVIETLCDLLEKMEIVNKAWEEAGKQPTVIYSNGNAGCEPNLKVYMELSNQALRYWSELGLTPSAYKKMTGETVKVKVEEPKGLAAALMNLE